MATYDGEAFLTEQLASIAHQSRPPDELVVRDDGSMDATVSILRAFAAVTPFSVRVIAGGPHLGYAQNFVAAARATSGDLVLFADQDDIWGLEKIATVVASAGPNRWQAISHDLALLSDGDRRAASYFALLAERGFPLELSFKGCSLGVTRAFIDSWGWPVAGSPVSHDFWVALLGTAFGRRHRLDRVLVGHRLHAGNTSGWVASPDDRVFSREAGLAWSPVDTLLDVVVKGDRVTEWTDTFLAVLDERGDRIDAAAARRLRTSLVANRSRQLGGRI